ncbi:hypothetical protein IPZ61_17200 [Streptomyces sioyaensis]|uniref:hypothetical protein n=1 Tax=Streptomyces sioyaensis TaxID=67364 RepID=UPI001F2E0D95|nr:hypothetical protein [Streptomyces sioyaensis]MCF3175048.1 hypothetical protein [Streptomyces sioyaensis]
MDQRRRLSRIDAERDSRGRPPTLRVVLQNLDQLIEQYLAQSHRISAVQLR